MFFSRILFVSIGLLCMGFLNPVFAASNNEIVTGRYLTAAGRPLPEQIEPLTQLFQVRFPRSIKTIGDAVRYLLQSSGYHLVDKQQLPSPTHAILAQKLPDTIRTLGSLPLQDGLLVLVGDPFTLLVDPVHRLVSFQLREAYYPIYTRN
jgi:type IV pili sensor histidine kinase/response regulator